MVSDGYFLMLEGNTYTYLPQKCIYVQVHWHGYFLFIYKLPAMVIMQLRDINVAKTSVWMLHKIHYAIFCFRLVLPLTFLCMHLMTDRGMMGWDATWKWKIILV